MTIEHPIMWFLGNSGTPLFTHSDMLELLPRLTDDTLQNWANRNIVYPAIEAGRRRYDSFELGRIAVALPLVLDLGIGPMLAGLMSTQAITLMIRNLVDGKRIKPTGDDVPIDQVQHYYTVFFGRTGELPRIAHKNDLAEKAFRKADASTVVAFGRLILATAKSGQRLANTREGSSARVGGIDEVCARALAALPKVD